jgi:uncharacterized protein YkwD
MSEITSQVFYSVKNIIRLSVVIAVFALMVGCQTTENRRKHSQNTNAPLAAGVNNPTVPNTTTTQPAPIYPYPNTTTNPTVPTTTVPVVVTSSGDCYKAEQLICDIEHAIIRKTNALRSSPVTTNTQMIYASRVWSVEQARRRNIGHGGFPRERTRSVQEEFGTVSVSMNAENVAMTSSRQSATAEDIAEAFVRMWKNSPGHRRNMLGNHQSMGAGVARNGNTWYATQIFGRSR